MIEQQYIYTCDQCGSKKRQSYKVGNYVIGRHQAPLYPEAPAGWQVIQNSLVCEKHCVDVKIVSIQK